MKKIAELTISLKTQKNIMKTKLNELKTHPESSSVLSLYYSLSKTLEDSLAKYKAIKKIREIKYFL